MADTKIEWATKVWNPVRGCSQVSAGCRNCYAMRQAHRFSGPGKPYEGLTRQVPGKGPTWTGKVRCVEEMLDAPLRWKKPAKVFVNSMSDLFHPDIPFGFVDKVFAIMALCSRHTFQVLTKRPERARKYLALGVKGDWVDAAERMGHPFLGVDAQPWPLPNVWLGTSVENQETADTRIPHLLQTPAAVRWLSMEPLLGPVEIRQTLTYHRKPDEDFGSFGKVLADLQGIDWIVAGGESGPNARPMDVAWIRSIVTQCQSASVPVFVKQLGARPFAVEGSRDAHLWTPNGRDGIGYMDDCGQIHLCSRKGSDPSEWPRDLRVQEFPEVAHAR